jgi:hypothetical protein
VLEGLQQLGRNALVRGPRVRQPLDSVCIGVLGGGEPAFGQRKIAEQVLARVRGHAPVALLARHDPRVEVGRDEQRVVVEHLLEVRHEPALVDRVPVEAAADEVVHPARRHRVERRGDQVELAPAEQEVDRRGGRELRRAAEATPLRVEDPAQVARRLAEHGVGQRLG